MLGIIWVSSKQGFFKHFNAFCASQWNTIGCFHFQILDWDCGQRFKTLQKYPTFIAMIKLLFVISWAIKNSFIWNTHTHTQFSRFRLWIKKKHKKQWFSTKLILYRFLAWSWIREKQRKKCPKMYFFFVIHFC